MNSGLEAAKAKRLEMLSRGEKLCRDPMEKARKNPKSKRAAINAMCFDCVGGNSDGGWRNLVETCQIENCPLFLHRPRSKSARFAPIDVRNGVEEKKDGQTLPRVRGGE